MIDYDVNRFGGLHILVEMAGSVLPRAVVPTIVSGLVCFLVIRFSSVQDELSPDDSSLQVFRNYLRHPYPHQITTIFVGFMMVFRVQLSYGRYWEGITTLVDMSTKWYDAAVQVCAFDELATGEAERAGPGFRAHAVHLFSLMSACGLLELKHENLSVFTQPRRGDGRRAWVKSRMLRRVLGLAPLPPDFGGRDAVEVLGGFLDDELEHLARHEPNFVDCVMARLVRLISVRLKDGGLNMPPPIVSRIYQELSNGSLGFHQAHKIARVPFPFPYAQLLSIMKIYFIVTVPLAVVCFTSDAAFAIFMSAFTSLIFSCLNEVALELEDPFGNDANDLPLQEMHSSFNHALEHLLHIQPPESDSVKGAELMTLQSGIRTVSRMQKRGAGEVAAQLARAAAGAASAEGGAAPAAVPWAE